MSDSKPAAEEASSNPAEAVAQTENAAQDKVTEQSDDKPAVVEAAADCVADSTKADKPEESSEKSKTDEKKENGHADKKRGSDRKDDRYSKYDRGDKRKGSYNDKSRTKSKKPKNNEFESLPETDDPFEIRAQVEFYFSVQNLCTDKHMFIEIKGAENRPVPIKHITSFKRMRRFQPYSAVVAALRDSKDLLVIDDGEYAGTGNEAIQRKEPLAVPKRDNDDEYKPTIEELYHRMFRASQNKLDASIYVKGFGKEEDAGQIALEHFFKPYGSVMVRKRRDEDENWKGSVFVEFDSEDSQQQFLALDPKPKFNGNDLLIMSKKAYSEKKCAEKGITPAWLQDPSAVEGGRGNFRDRDGGRGRGRGGRGRGRGGNDRGGRGHDRRHNDRRHNNRDRSRSRSRSPREGQRSRRDRSGSRDSRDWNDRRDKFQKSREYGRDKRDRREKSDKSRSSKMDDKENSFSSKSVIKDADGVPIVQDTREEPTKSSSKRKAEDDGEASPPKKSKIEVKVDG